MLLVTAVVGMTFTGCKKEEEVVEPEPEPEVVEVVEEEPVEVEPVEILPANQNLLTGEIDLTDEAIGKRPLAIMVNNVNDAMPQYGVGEADIIFELPVEGNLTRFMAVFADYTQVPEVCAIRSCRYNFPTLSEGFDAYYAFWGMDDSTRPYFNSLETDHFDGMANTAGMFSRDQDRINSGYSLEHTAVFDGPSLVEAVESQGYRTEIEEDNAEPAFLFNGLEEQLKAEGEDCIMVETDFGAAVGTFNYDEENKVYLKQLNGNDQIDGKTEEQLAFTNVFILETEIGLLENGVHKRIDMEGGNGYYVSNGGVQEITWKKDGGEANSHLEFYDLDGEELSINRGKSYIAFNSPDQTVFE